MLADQLHSTEQQAFNFALLAIFLQTIHFNIVRCLQQLTTDRYFSRISVGGKQGGCRYYAEKHGRGSKARPIFGHAAESLAQFADQRMILRGLLPPVPEVEYCQNRMVQQHPRPREPHYIPDSFSHDGLVAMDGALSAGRLFLAEYAAVQPANGIVQKSLTILAQRTITCVVFAAINPDHRRDGRSFATYPTPVEREGSH